MNVILGTMTIGESIFEEDASKFVYEYLQNGRSEIDTAYVYNNGECERILGRVLSKVNRTDYKIATKVNPRITGKLDGEAADMQINESLQRLGLNTVDTVYLHFPDPNTPMESVLEKLNELHIQGKFNELGLSNFPAWMVADVCNLCSRKGWMLPKVFEGIYNPLTRMAETELDACLNHFCIRFNAYNPLAGGLLTGKYTDFFNNPESGRFVNRPNYIGRYWKKSYFEAIGVIQNALADSDIDILEASFRWLKHHSMLNTERGDGVIIGASKLSQLKKNLECLSMEQLPEHILQAFDKAWRICKGDCPEYFTLYKGK